MKRRDGVSLDPADELTRGDVLLKGTLAVGAIYGLGAVAPYVSRVLASGGGGDAAVLNYLLPFEYLQVSLYNRASTEINDKGEKLPLGSREKELLGLFLEEDGQHVAALKKMIEELGGEPVKKKGYAFAFRIFVQVLGIATTIEDTSVGAYNGALSVLDSAEARELVYSIVQVDARHAATVRIGDGENPTPYPFDHAVPEQDSIAHVLPYTGEYEEEFKQSG